MFIREFAFFFWPSRPLPPSRSGPAIAPIPLASLNFFFPGWRALATLAQNRKKNDRDAREKRKETDSLIPETLSYFPEDDPTPRIYALSVAGVPPLPEPPQERVNSRAGAA